MSPGSIDSVENPYGKSWYQRPAAPSSGGLPPARLQHDRVVDDIKKVLPQFQASLPPSVKLDVVFDRSQTIRASVDDVQDTLMIAGVLVVGVIFVFLRRVSATLIPSLALPIAVIGTFAGMARSGYNLDNLSLMALTLSVGFVVDDAIVMLENIVRHIEKGEKPYEAAMKGSARNRLHHPVHDHLAGRGVHPHRVHGRHRRPAAARIRRHHHHRDPLLRHRLGHPDADAVRPRAAGRAWQKHNAFYRWSENAFNAVQDAYDRTPALEPRHAAIILGVFVASIVASVGCYDHAAGFPAQRRHRPAAGQGPGGQRHLL